MASDETEAATIASAKEYIKAAKDGEDDWIQELKSLSAWQP